METNIQTQEEPIVRDSDFVGKQTHAVPKPEKGIGIDTKGVLTDNIINAGTSSQLDISAIENFTQLSQSRETIYQLLDTMSEDPTIAAVLETYAEDATETNDQGKIVWCESDDPQIAQFVTYLLDTMNVDKNIYRWIYSLCKYGDCYLRLYRESEFKDALFDEDEEEENKKLNEALHPTDIEEDNKSLQEDVKIKVFSQNDKYVHYLEMMPNPAEMFELTKFGKSYAYIQSQIPTSMQKNQQLINSSYRYFFKKKDITVYNATNFVHAALEDNSSRVPEEVEIFKDDTDETEGVLTYTVKRGQSLLYNTFKIWRELMLLENSMLLNRITKSSVVRIVNVEVGDMPKENVGPHLMGIKQLMEQKTAINEGNSLSEYTNPGPMENNIYVPVHNQLGTINMQNIGGEANVTGLDDVEYFKNKFFGSLRVPKQYFGDTNDSTGFNGGTSLSLISSRYAKMIKRIQNTMVQAITDAVNLMLLDKGLQSYINRFELHMLNPTTTEENDRKDAMDKKVGVVTNIMSLLGDIESPSTKLKIVKSLLTNVVSDSDVMSAIQDEIDKMEELGDREDMNPEDEELGGMMPDTHSGMHMSRPSLSDNEPPEDLGGGEEGGNEEETQPEAPEGETILPSPKDLGLDLTDNEAEV